MFISNSSTLILLAKINTLRTFLENCDSIIIPEEVYQESVKNKNSFDALLIAKEIGNKIKIQKTNKKTEQIQKQFRMDIGEAAAYLLYDPKLHKAILTDDRELIKLCKIENIPFICAIAIVVQLHKNKKITKEECLEKMAKLETIGRYSKEIVDYFESEVK